MNKEKKHIVYIISVLVVSYIYSLLYFKFPYGTKIGFILTSFYMFLPLTVSVILQKFIYKEPLKNIYFNFKLSKWLFFSWFIPFLWVGIAFLISLLMPDVKFCTDFSGMIERYKTILTPEQIQTIKEQVGKVPAHLFFIGIIFQALLAGITINTIFGFGEEAGWRGFFLKSLEKYSFYKTSLIIGFIWGIWHIPVIIQGHNYPEHRILGVFMMIIWTILLSPFFIYIVYKTKSVLYAAIMHGSLNATAGLAVLYIKGGNDLLVGLTGLSGFIALFISNLVLYLYDKYFDEEKIINVERI